MTPESQQIFLSLSCMIVILAIVAGVIYVLVKVSKIGKGE